MTTPTPTGCAWPVSYAACGPVVNPLIADDEEQKLAFETMAGDYLRSWTGLGTCPVSLRPCRVDCAGQNPTFWGFGPYTKGSQGRGGAPWTPTLINGAWVNLTCGTCGDLCSCGNTAPSIVLPGPVASVEQVIIDGELLPEESYRVDNGTLLVRLDGLGWPTCQDMALPTSAPGTWQVDYQRGVEVPLGGQLAAGILANEFAKAACSDPSCQLPQRIQSVSRQGITVAVLDTFDDVSKGRTGIWLVDSWVASVNAPRKGGQVRSVDVPRPKNRVTTWPRT